MSLVILTQKLRDRQFLSAEEIETALEIMVDDAASADHIIDFLLAMNAKGPTALELAGAARWFMRHARTIQAPSNAMDIVGTGGDVHGTLNISTAAALVVAACGVPIAKHGNRAVTSRSGSSDVLSALGVTIEVNTNVLEQCLKEANICFLYAPSHHPLMMKLMPIRRKIGVRTILNILGPLTNPAHVKYGLIGISDKKLHHIYAETLKLLGYQSAWVVHGHDGLDEISTTGPTKIVKLAGEELILHPNDLGMPIVSLNDIKGGNASENAERLLELFAGEKGPYRDIVVMNAAAALVIAGISSGIASGAKLACEAIDQGGASATLNKLIQITHHAGI